MFKKENPMEHKVTGKIVHKDGRYFLEAAGKMETLPVGLLTDRTFLDEHVGKDVEVLYSIPSSFVVAIKPAKSIIKGPIGLCNIPRPEFLGFTTLVTQPSVAVARNIATALLKGGQITQEVHDTIVNSY
jgi:hypothetical protein